MCFLEPVVSDTYAVIGEKAYKKKQLSKKTPENSVSKSTDDNNIKVDKTAGSNVTPPPPSIIPVYITDSKKVDASTNSKQVGTSTSTNSKPVGTSTSTNSKQVGTSTSNSLYSIAEPVSKHIIAKTSDETQPVLIKNDLYEHTDPFGSTPAAGGASNMDTELPDLVENDLYS